MQRLFLAVFAVFLCFALPLQDAEAKRFGGGKSYGMQRQAPMKREATPNQSPNQAQNTAAQSPGKRSWMGPLAGLAAGVGLAALLSHFGLGEGMANILMMALLALAAFMLIRWFMRSNQPQTRPLQHVGAEAGANQPVRFEPAQTLPGSVASLNGHAATMPTTSILPPDFDGGMRPVGMHVQPWFQIPDYTCAPPSSTLESRMEVPLCSRDGLMQDNTIVGYFPGKSDYHAWGPKVAPKDIDGVRVRYRYLDITARAHDPGVLLLEGSLHFDRAMKLNHLSLFNVFHTSEQGEGDHFALVTPETTVSGMVAGEPFGAGGRMGPG
ncbi:MAG: hypothetical protein GW802_35405, partial [Armatimonadetes bacterium]|nr:hypothetical protein [Armatimonadota bacterium]